MKNKINLFGAIIFLFFSFTSFSIEHFLRLNIKVFDELTHDGLKGAEVQIYMDDVLFMEEFAGNGGKVVSIEVPVNKIYRIYFKKKGYVTKLAEIDATYSMPQNLPKIYILPMEASLFETDNNYDLAFLEETPMVKYKYDANGIIKHDEKYTAAILHRIEDIRKGR